MQKSWGTLSPKCSTGLRHHDLKDQDGISDPTVYVAGGDSGQGEAACLGSQNPLVQMLRGANRTPSLLGLSPAAHIGKNLASLPC